MSMVGHLEPGKLVAIFTSIGSRYVGRVVSVGKERGKDFVVLSLGDSLRPVKLLDNDVSIVNELD